MKQHNRIDSVAKDNNPHCFIQTNTQFYGIKIVLVFKNNTFNFNKNTFEYTLFEYQMLFK